MQTTFTPILSLLTIAFLCFSCQNNSTQNTGAQNTNPTAIDTQKTELPIKDTPNILVQQSDSKTINIPPIIEKDTITMKQNQSTNTPPAIKKEEIIKQLKEKYLAIKKGNKDTRSLYPRFYKNPH